MTDRHSSAAAHNRWWRDHAFAGNRVERPQPYLQVRRRGAFDPPHMTLYVPYDQRHDYTQDDVIEVEGTRWTVISIVYEPEHDRVAVGLFDTGYVERYKRGEIV